MRTVQYGEHRIDLIDGAGGLIRPAGPGADRPRRTRPPVIAVATPLGRETQVALALSALDQGRPVHFHGPCGVGKSTLLRHLALVAGRDFARPGAFLEPGPDEHPDDVVQDLLRELGLIGPHARATAGQARRILAATQPVVALDQDDGPSAALLDRLSGCLLVLGSEHPGISSHELAGLAAEDALALLQRDVGGPLDGYERTSALRLAAAVDGRPLPLRQAAALVRTGADSFANLADAAERDPAAIGRRAMSGLDRVEQDVIGILAVFGAALLPADLVEILGDAGACREALVRLRDRRVLESVEDRFGFAACRTPDHVERFFRTFDTTSAVRDIVDYLRASDPGADATLSLVKAVVTLIGRLAERRQWHAVVALVEAAEPILTLAGRWAACQRILDLGIHAAHEIGDWTAVSMFQHEQGTLAAVRGDIDLAREDLSRAYESRVRAGDHRAAEISLRNLRSLPAPVAPEPPPADPAGRGRPMVRRILTLGAMLAALLVLATGFVNVAEGDEDVVQPPPPSGSPSTAPSRSVSPAPSQPTKPTGGTPSTPPSRSPSSSDPGALPSLTPRRVNLGRYHLGFHGAPRRTLTLHNDRDVTVAFGPPRTTDTAFAVSADTGCGGVVAPHATCVITVVFAPGTVGEHEADLTVPVVGFPSVSAHLSAVGFRTLTVKVVKHNTDVGVVFDSSGVVNCGSGPCVYEFSQPQVNLGTTIETCEGCYSGFTRQGCGFRAPHTCNVSMDVDRTVTATFSHPDDPSPSGPEVE